MSDFLTNLLNRHIGIGEQVQPRVRARFEPDAMATFSPRNASKMEAMDTNNRHNDQESSHHGTSTVTSPTNGTTTNTMDDYNSVKQPVHNQRGQDIRSGESIRREISRETKYNSSSKSAHRPISEAPEDINKNKVFKNKRAKPGSTLKELVRQRENISEGITASINKNKVSKNKRAKPGNPSKESAKLRENVSEDMIPANEHNVEKRMDDKVKSTLSQMLSPDEKGDSDKPAKSDCPARIVTSNNQKGSHNQQSDQGQSATSKSSLGPSVKLTKTEPNVRESQASIAAIQNNETGFQRLLETPPWLFNRQKELHKGLILKNSKAESEPVVNITIGRIEVRATQHQAQKQSPRKRKPSGVMSLDKYLSQRIQGGNR